MSAPDPAPLDCLDDVVALTEELCNIASVSGEERELADRVEATVRQASHLEVIRHGNTVAARTHWGRASRVLLAGHLDTVPVQGLLPVTRREGALWGRGTVDMKAGVAVLLMLALAKAPAAHDMTFVFYDCEEVAGDRNGLGHFHRAHPDWFEAQFGVLAEPTNSLIEGGCNGTLRAEMTARGVAAHSARPWKGENAIHRLAPLLARLDAFQPETRSVEGLEYRESVQAVGIRGGIAGNVVPDEAVVTVNYRFAPDRTPEEAVEYITALAVGYEVELVDLAPGARPGLTSREAAELVARSGGEAFPKYGWTDVARLQAAGIPAVNFGPGDPSLAHADDEHVTEADIHRCAEVLRGWCWPQNL